jgi:hypothetical protein
MTDLRLHHLTAQLCNVREVDPTRSQAWVGHARHTLLTAALLLLSGCGTIVVTPRFIDSEAVAMPAATASVRLETFDRHVGGRKLGTTQDIYQRPIQSDAVNRPEFAGGSIPWEDWSHGKDEQVFSGGA